MHAFAIIGATPSDTADVVRLFGALHRHNASLDPRFELAAGWERLVQEYLLQSQESQDSAWLLAQHDGCAIGFVLVEVHTESPLYRYRRWAEIVGLYVEPEYRGSNVAQLLMEHAYAWAVQHNLRVMQLYVTASNDQAQRFYAKQGFETRQLILRRTLTTADVQPEDVVEHAQHRLHFSESGARPLDMHGHSHAPSESGGSD
ncbi:MAG: GNAT family N-acetyltransferase [Chloroflexota bacterium]|nr:GNAT family N-acetyltransferase [Chloroflexota bacterium]